jgi:hypothetical protein
MVGFLSGALAIPAVINVGIALKIPVLSIPFVAADRSAIGADCRARLQVEFSHCSNLRSLP